MREAKIIAVQKNAIRATLLRRTQYFLYISVVACILFLACFNLFRVKDLAILNTIVGSGTVALLFCIWLSKRNLELAAEGLLGIMSMICVLSIWNAEGYFGVGMNAMPGILIFAAMLGSNRSFLIIMLFFIANIVLMWLAYYVGLTSFSQHSNDTLRPLLALIILSISGTSIYIVIKDYTAAISELNRENAKVRESERAIAFLAKHDSLTELPNRIFASERFEQAIKRMDRAQMAKKIALIFLDLDDFKTINDSLGHETGDRYLIAIAERLRDATRANDTVCRLGGDEFILILEDLNDERDASKAAQAIQQRISCPVITGQHKLVCSASMGIAIYPNDGDRYEDLVKKADIAMYRAKDLGRNTFCYFSPVMNTDALDRMHLLEDLRSALENNELFVEFQPIVLLNTGKIVGAEALLRWQHPSRGLVGPDVFIPLAEKSGLIVEIGAWVLEKACLEVVDLQKNYSPDFRLAVNVSSVQLKRDDFKERVRDILARVPIAPNTLELEITESELISDSPEFDDAIKELKAMGIALAIDDFGTGYSNLGYVQKIKVAKLKIDRSFVSGIEHNLDNQAIVRAVHNIADGLIMNTVAEGIEQQAELEFLKQLGITHGQGYLWSKAVSMPALIQLLKNAV